MLWQNSFHNPSHLETIKLLEDLLGSDSIDWVFSHYLFRNISADVSTELKFKFNDDTSGKYLVDYVVLIFFLGVLA